MARDIEAIQFPARIDAGLGQLARETSHERYVKQLIHQVLLTTPGERVNRPDFGAGLRRMVFSPNDDSTATLLQTTIYQNLTRWLSDLIEVNEVRVSANDSRLDTTIVYTLRASAEEQVLNLEVTE